MMPLVVVDDIEPLRPFYTELLTFDETIHRASVDGAGAFVAFSFLEGRLGFSTPTALPELPGGPTRNLMVVFEVQDVASLRSVIARRAPDVPTPLATAPWGDWFQVVDPAGTVVRFIDVTETGESPPE